MDAHTYTQTRTNRKKEGRKDTKGPTQTQKHVHTHRSIHTAGKARAHKHTHTHTTGQTQQTNRGHTQAHTHTPTTVKKDAVCARTLCGHRDGHVCRKHVDKKRTNQQHTHMYTPKPKTDARHTNVQTNREC